MSFDPPPLPPRYTPEQFQVWWQVVLGGLKTELGALAAAIAAQATATTALANAAAAQATATTADATATAVKKTDKISASWTSPGDIITATDAGASATVNVAAHTRKWGDGTSTSVNSHSFTGKAYGTDYYIYYTDANQNDTTPSYQITTSATTAAPNSATNRVYVGTVTTPTAGAPDTDGGSTFPGGGGVVRPNQID